jgi:peptidoglycan/LPS O-acetylase OafA/YrhL
MRIKQLDVLRGIAIWLVLGRHQPFNETYSGFGASFFKLLGQVGWIGVDLFFVLSGFLVSGLLFKEYQVSGKINLWLFLIRRGFKIYPAYYFLIFFTIIFYFVFLHYLIPVRVIWEQFLFLQNYFVLLWGHTWSLAVEEHFYFLVGLFLFLCAKKKLTDPFKIIGFAFFLIALGCLFLRLLNCVSYGIGVFVPQTHLFLTHLRIDSLMFGVLLAYLHHFHYLRFKQFIVANKKRIVFLSCAVLSPVFMFDLSTTPFIYTFGLTLNYLALGGFLVVFLYCIEIKEGKFNLLAKIGINSYSIYLWHFPIIQWIILPMTDFIGVSNISLFVLMMIYFLFTIFIGIYMAKLIEVPFLKYRDNVLLSAK